MLQSLYVHVAGKLREFFQRVEATGQYRCDTSTPKKSIDPLKFAPNALREPWQTNIWRPVIAEPPLCTRKELSDGTYSIDDLADMNEILDLRDAIIAANNPQPNKR